MAVTKKKTSTGKANAISLTAGNFLKNLRALAAGSSAHNARFFKGDDAANKFLDLRMSGIFALAKQFRGMPLEEIDKLLGSNFYEARMGAVSIMDFQARDKKISADQRKQLYTLYIKRHKRINNWDLVDRAAPYVVGGYLFDKDREPLYKLAMSGNVWERRTAIVSTYFFIRQNQTEDTFRMAELLVHDEHELIHTAVGSWVREAGKRDIKRLLSFLDQYAATMPRITLRYAVEKLDKKYRDRYLKSLK